MEGPVKKCHHENGSASFDDLPNAVVDNILVRLPIKEAVKTSVLSTNWQYKWHNLSELEFLMYFSSPSTETIYSDTIDPCMLVSIVEQVLLLHNGPIKRFRISGPCPEGSAPHIYRWLHYLSLNGIEELDLRFWNDVEPIRVHPTLFFCSKLNSLSLCNCTVKIPRSFDGLRSLEKIVFLTVSVTQIDLENLLSQCPLLSYFCIVGKGGIDGIINWLYKKKRNLLTFLRICLYNNDDDGENLGMEETSKMVKLFEHLPAIECLDLGRDAFLYFSAGIIPSRFATCDNLKTLNVKINIEDMNDISAACSMFRSLPNLHQLVIDAWADKVNSWTPVEDSFKPEDHFDFSFKQLQIVNMDCLQGKMLELELIKYILGSAPRLKTMSIILDDNAIATPKLFSRLLRFKRASTQAEIVFEVDEEED